MADSGVDCRYFYPVLPEIEETNPEFIFILIGTEISMDIWPLWDVYGIPSLVVLE